MQEVLVYLSYLAPETWLCFLGFLILTLDFALPRLPKRWLSYVAVIGMFIALLLILFQQQMISQLGDGRALKPSTGWSRWLSEAIVADSFAVYFKLTICIGTLLVILSAIDYAEKRITFGRGEFYAFLCFAALSMCFMACSVELITLFLSIEFASISSYILAAYLRDDPKSSEAGMKYFLVGATTTAVTLYGMSLLYGLTGTTHIYQIADILRGVQFNKPLVVVAIVMMLASLGFKVAMVPFHGWAPDAYEGAPTPITAFLSVASKAAGFAVILRVLVMGFGAENLMTEWKPAIAAISAITMTLGNLIAIPQSNIKRMLAYSSIAQVGYILIGVASFTPHDWSVLKGTAPAPTSTQMSLPGLLFYVLAYTFANVGAFGVVILVSNAINSDLIEDYAGLIHRSPVAAVALTVFLLSLIGIPPLAGFWGKLMLFAGALYRDLAWLAVLGVLNTVVSVYYYAEVMRRMFFFPPKQPLPIASTFPLNTVLLIGFVGTLGLGIFPAPVIDVAAQSIVGILSRLAGA